MGGHFGKEAENRNEYQWNLESIVWFNIVDVEKYKKIYQEIAQLDPEDTLQLILEADTEEQREFYQVVGDFLLQKKQKEVIERNLF